MLATADINKRSFVFDKISVKRKERKGKERKGKGKERKGKGNLSGIGIERSCCFLFSGVN